MCVYIYAYLFWHAYGAMSGICYIADYGAVYLYGKYLSIYIYIHIYISIYRCHDLPGGPLQTGCGLHPQCPR